MERTVRCAKGIGQGYNISDRFSNSVANYQSYQRSKNVDSPFSGGLSLVDKKSEVLAPLCEALKDEAVGVRQSAGNALMDLGDRQAIGPMVETLKDLMRA